MRANESLMQKKEKRRVIRRFFCVICFFLLENWSERRDLNPRPFAPEANALPGCATLRLGKIKSRRRPTLARASPALPSAKGPLTSVFGMGTGIAAPLWPPAKMGWGLKRSTTHRDAGKRSHVQVKSPNQPRSEQSNHSIIRLFDYSIVEQNKLSRTSD